VENCQRASYSPYRADGVAEAYSARPITAATAAKASGFGRRAVAFMLSSSYISKIVEIWL